MVHAGRHPHPSHGDPGIKDGVGGRLRGSRRVDVAPGSQSRLRVDVVAG